MATAAIGLLVAQGTNIFALKAILDLGVISVRPNPAGLLVTFRFIPAFFEGVMAVGTFCILVDVLVIISPEGHKLLGRISPGDIPLAILVRQQKWRHQTKKDKGSKFIF